MIRRVICFLAALALALLPVLACAECNHHDEEGRPYGLVPSGYVPPQPGVPGWSGDMCCAACGAVVIRGTEIPALPEEDHRKEKLPDENDPKPVPALSAGAPEEPAPEPPVLTSAQDSAVPPPEEQAPQPQPVPQQTNTGKKSQTATKGEPFSEKYPYRRIRLTPEEGIRAEAAGTPVWPAIGDILADLFV